MKNEEQDIQQFSDKGKIRQFWLRAFLIYAIAEAVFLGISSAITYSQCKYCLLPFPFYIWQYLMNLLLTAMLWYGLNIFYHYGIWKVIAGNILIFLLYYFIYTSTLYVVLNSRIEWLMGPGAKFRSFDSVVYGSWFDIGKYVLKLSAFYVLKFYVVYKISAQQRMKLAMINKDMQLNLLKQQLNPHFYFNTLNNLYGLSRSNDPRLTTALNQLSNIMQYVIVDCNEPKVMLSQEIKFLESYIELERLRYEKDTVIEIHTEGQTNDLTIIPLLLIQFVENAFKHGMKEKSDKNWMKVMLKVVDRELFFSVTNSYYDPASKEGIGLTSVRRILDLQYEGGYDLIMLHEEKSFSVTLKLSL